MIVALVAGLLAGYGIAIPVGAVATYLLTLTARTSLKVGACAALEARGLVERRPDPADGRRAVISATEAGLQALRNRRSARTEQLAQALSAEFTRSELRQLMAAVPLIERLAHSI